MCFFFGFVLAYSYFDLRSKILSLDNKNKKIFLFCILLAYSYFDLRSKIGCISKILK